MQIALVGEAWGADEERERKPFVGASGRLLNAMLAQVGISRKECLVTNVFNLRPYRNDVKTLCGPKAEGIPGLPPLAPGKYVKAEYGGEILRLHDELRKAKPNVIVALGASAAWATLGTSGIRKIRGAAAPSPFGKVLPTYHPAAVLREWTLRPILLADLMKARREAEYPEVRRPEREIWIDPTLEDLFRFEREHIAPNCDLSIDIETTADSITCIGFAPTPWVALVVPFFDPRKPDGNYWRTAQEERTAWDWVKRICGLRKRIVFQNGLYDMHFLWRTMGITVPYAEDDTMLLHHALQPELEKGLGFLGSIYTDEASWKFMRKTNTVKRED